MPCGGITDGMWNRFDGEWWCSTGIFGSLCFVLYDQTGDPAYLKVGMKAVDWLNRQHFENAQHIDFKEAAPSVLMYVFEAYSAGMPHLQHDPLRWEASQVELRRALAWMDANQPSRNPKSTWKFDHQWGSKLGGLPFHAGVWSRFLTDGPTILAAVDKDLVQLAQTLQADPSKLYQLRVFALMSFAERLMPGAMYRADPPKVVAKAPNPDGPVDHDVPALRVVDAQGHDRAILFGYACHNTTLGSYEFCGDYAGFAQQYLQEDEPGVTALFIAGCGADQNPYPRSTLEQAREHGRSLAAAVEAALFAYPRPLDGSLHTAMERIRLQKTPGRPDLEYPVQVISLGPDVTLIVLASEVTVDYSLRLKRQLAKPPAMIWVAGYCNAYFGYIPSDRVLAEGGYEADGWKTPIEERIIAKALELVRSASAPAMVKAGK